MVAGVIKSNKVFIRRCMFQRPWEYIIISSSTRRVSSYALEGLSPAVPPSSTALSMAGHGTSKVVTPSNGTACPEAGSATTQPRTQSQMEKHKRKRPLNVVEMGNKMVKTLAANGVTRDEPQAATVTIAFGRAGVLQAARGPAPSEAEAFGICGILEAERGPYPSDAKAFEVSGVLEGHIGLAAVHSADGGTPVEVLAGTDENMSISAPEDNTFGEMTPHELFCSFLARAVGVAYEVRTTTTNYTRHHLQPGHHRLSLRCLLSTTL